ncbi:hypothetical protein MPAR162_18290 [Methylorubrum populi]|uniref:hypothetical protein n=1 Tax=Methylorubrum populi TaxID=223967 RepID=UPI002F346A9C
MSARRTLPEGARRGWCPSLARPMPTGDGLLARVHPPLGALSAAQMRAVAAGARAHGNGHIDVTARGNLQIRGVSEASAPRLACALAQAGLGDTRDDGGPQRLPDDPRRAVAACPGAPACCSGTTPVPDHAARLAQALAPLAGLGTAASVHVSGCAKGCAHPGPADLTLVGRDGAYDVVLAGPASGKPATRLAFEAALDRIRKAAAAGLSPPDPMFSQVFQDDVR